MLPGFPIREHPASYSAPVLSNHGLVMYASRAVVEMQYGLQLTWYLSCNSIYGIKVI